jgi:hypothetical protein
VTGAGDIRVTLGLKWLQAVLADDVDTLIIGSVHFGSVVETPYPAQ